jgi:hypothetical protein
MRPRATKDDLPSTYDVKKHLHNEYAVWIAKLKSDIEVSDHLSVHWQGDLPATTQRAPGMISTTADGWSVDTTKAAFLGVTGHWIDVKEGKWNLRSEVHLENVTC